MTTSDISYRNYKNINVQFLLSWNGLKGGIDRNLEDVEVMALSNFPRGVKAVVTCELSDSAVEDAAMYCRSANIRLVSSGLKLNLGVSLELKVNLGVCLGVFTLRSLNGEWSELEEHTPVSWFSISKSLDAEMIHNYYNFLRKLFCCEQ